VANFTSEVIGH